MEDEVKRGGKRSTMVEERKRAEQLGAVTAKKERERQPRLEGKRGSYKTLACSLLPLFLVSVFFVDQEFRLNFRAFLTFRVLNLGLYVSRRWLYSRWFSIIYYFEKTSSCHSLEKCRFIISSGRVLGIPKLVCLSWYVDWISVVNSTIRDWHKRSTVTNLEMSLRVSI